METLDDLRDCFCALLDGELSPLATGETVCEAALGRGNGQWPWLWLPWAQLTARWAEDENARRQAEDEMRLAAKDWLFVADGEASWHVYFDRWLNTGLGSVGDREPEHESLLRGASTCRAGSERDRPGRTSTDVLQLLYVMRQRVAAPPREP